MPKGRLRLLAIGLLACGVGVLGGLVGVGGGTILVPLLVLFFAFDQHIAQGTSLIALVPPTGLLAFLEYYHAGQVDVRAGLLLMPGVFLGGIAGARLAQRLSPHRMRRVFAFFVFLLGGYHILSAWWYR